MGKYIDKGKLENIKSIIYIVLILYSGMEIHSNLNQINEIIYPQEDINLNVDFGYGNLVYETVSFTYYEFSLYNLLFFEIVIYINIIIMLLIFLSNNAGGIIEYNKYKEW